MVFSHCNITTLRLLLNSSSSLEEVTGLGKMRKAARAFTKLYHSFMILLLFCFYLSRPTIFFAKFTIYTILCEKPPEISGGSSVGFGLRSIRDHQLLKNSDGTGSEFFGFDFDLCPRVRV